MEDEIKKVDFTGNLSSKDENATTDFESKIKSAKEQLDLLLEQDITLSRSMEIYNHGMKDLEVAQKLLDEAKLQFEEIINKKA
ncbi:MAG TPA: exonuclease VII small subunit [Arcobacter sp.]|jgi:exodeoxyribonuclease VII small subunit|nr:exonuclease VII small subunit [Arcobacter sp.]